FYFDRVVDHLDGDALRNRDWLLADSGHVRYQILQRTSPPTPAFTAARPVITPREVVRMLVPSPASTSGTSALPKYTRRPGRLMRSTPVMRRSPCGPYFKNRRSVLSGPACFDAASSSTLKPWM